MPDESRGYAGESRDDVLLAPSLFELLCRRTAEEFRARGVEDSPTVSFAGLILVGSMGLAFYVFGKPQFSKATFILFGLLLLWTLWGMVIRSSSRALQKADDIKNGAFPPDAAPLVLVRLKWWNHLVAPLHWARHSRITDRRSKLERRIKEAERQIGEFAAKPGAEYSPPAAAEIEELSERLANLSARKDYENGLASLEAGLPRMRGEYLLYQALLLKLNALADKLDKIDKLSVVFQNFNPTELGQVVAEAVNVLEERRILVASVDLVDPDSFIDLVTVRAVE